MGLPQLSVGVGRDILPGGRVVLSPVDLAERHLQKRSPDYGGVEGVVHRRLQADLLVVVVAVHQGEAVRDGLQPGRLGDDAGDGTEAITLVRNLNPDVVLMDLRMPEMDGVAAIARLRELAPAVPVLVLTAYDTDADIVRAIEAGATGYLLKDATREELLHAIRSAVAGRSALAPSVASRLVARMAAPAGSALSAREIEVLELVARGRGNKRSHACSA